MLRVWDSWRGLSCCQAATGVALVKVAGLLLEDLLRPVAADLLVLSMREGPGPFPDPQPRTPKILKLSRFGDTKTTLSTTECLLDIHQGRRIQIPSSLSRILKLMRSLNSNFKG